MRALWAVATLIALVLGAWPFSARAEVRRFAVVVGQNRGPEGATVLRYAERDASRMASLLVQLGEFDHADLELLQGVDAAAVEAALARSAAAQSAALASGDDVLFLFFYSGHAGSEGLELADTTLSFDTLEQAIEALPATARVVLVDACQSGALARLKTGRRREAFDVAAQARLEVQGTAILTASAAEEAAQESDALRASYFTHFVLAGLRGAADASADGGVSLGELYDYVYRRTVAATAASLAGAQHPSFSLRLAGHGELRLSELSASAGRLEIPPGPTETFFVLDEHESELVGEVERESTRAVHLALPARTYRLKRRAGAEFYAQTITIAPGETTHVDPDSMQPVELSRDVARGGLFRETERHAIGVAVEYANAALEGQMLGLRGRVGFASAFAGVGEVDVSVSYGGTPVVDGAVSSTVHRMGVECALLVRIPLEPVFIGLGGAVEGVLWIQALENEARTIAGLRYGALLGVEVLLGQEWALWARGQLGAELLPGSTRLRHEPSGTGTLGVRYHFAL